MKSKCPHFLLILTFTLTTVAHAQYVWYENETDTNNIVYTTPSNGAFFTDATKPETTSTNNNATVSKFIRNANTTNGFIDFRLYQPITATDQQFTLTIKAYIDLADINGINKLRAYLNNSNYNGESIYKQLNFTAGKQWQTFNFVFNAGDFVQEHLDNGGYDEIYIGFGNGQSYDTEVTYYIDSISATTAQEAPEPIRPNVDWIKGSWGVTFPVFGGEALDKAVDVSNYNHVKGAQEIVDELPSVGHVITNLSYFAHSHYFPLRANTNVDIANEIHPSIVPSAANDEIIYDVYKTFKNAGKKVILYISTNYFDRADEEVKAAWIAYYTKNFDGNEYLAYKDLIRGFVENVKDYADGYWFDTATTLIEDGNYDDFVNMFKEVDPTALMGSGGGSYLGLGTDNNEDDLIYVDSDGIDDTDESDYKIFINTPNSDEDFTKGHVTPLGYGAPPNSWAYEEFTIPDMMTEPVVEINGKSVVKQAWFPIRERWHSPQVDIVFNAEEAYRFVRRVTDAGAALTFANTTQARNFGDGNPGHMMDDEMAIMKEINRRLLMNPMEDYIPYTRPEGATLVGETQYIEFPDIPVKKLGDADFIPATATSGLAVSLTSSNSNVATIVNGKVHIVGAGTTTITASQSGNASHTAAIDAIRPLQVIFSPDPNKTYYIDALNGKRLAATGESGDAYTVSTSSTGNNVKWKFIAKGNRYWHIQRAAGGTRPRLRTDNTAYADMRGSDYNGVNTYFEIKESSIYPGAYHLTLPNGPTDHKRLQLHKSTETVRMIADTWNGPWATFNITEVPETKSNISKDNTISSVSMHPNPINNSFVISKEITAAAIYNISGQKVLEFSENQDNYDISKLDIGLYLLKIYNAQGETESIRFVKE